MCLSFDTAPLFYKYIKDKSYENIHANCLSTYFLFIY